MTTPSATPFPHRQRPHRAGRYVTQPTGFRAFIPAPLPPGPAIDIDAAMLQLLSSADRALGRLDGAIETLPNPGLFIAMFVRKEAVLSSQIEGTQSSLLDVLAAEARLHSAVVSDVVSDDVGEVSHQAAATVHDILTLREADVQAWIETSYPTANDLVHKLQQGGILDEITGHSRNRHYAYRPDHRAVPSR